MVKFLDMNPKRPAHPIDSIQISQQTRRRFILGKAGLWPGRRWQGKQGAAQAIHAIESLQIDPVMVVAQSHDLALWGRVAEYEPNHLTQLMDEERQFFAYGGCLFIYPMKDLPYIKTLMAKARNHSRYDEIEKQHPGIYKNVMDHIRANGPSRSRKMEGKSVSDYYRGSKDVGLALYYAWYVGDLMIHGRAGRDRLYDLTERIAPPEFNYAAETNDAMFALTLKSIRTSGLATEREAKYQTTNTVYAPSEPEHWKNLFTTIARSGSIVPVTVEGDKTVHYVTSEDVDTLLKVQNGEVPQQWLPLTTNTEEEVVFLSPLDYVSARGRAKKLFNFNYIWEIYKPNAKRQYGPYTLPILYGDQLVGRMDGKHDRAKGEFIINGRWLEEGFTPTPQFESAYNAGLEHLKNFLNR